MAPLRIFLLLCLVPLMHVAHVGVPALYAQSLPVAVIDTTEDPQALGYPDSRKLVADAQGRLYVAYRKKFRQLQLVRYHIFVARSSDQGVTWTVLNQGQPVETVGDYTQRVPTLAIDPADGLHLVWYGEDAASLGVDDRQIKYVRSTDGGATWSTWQNIAPVPGYTDQSLWQEHPMLYAAGDDKLYVVWQGRDATYTSHSQIKFIQSTDGGLTWSTWRNIYPESGRFFSRPSLVAAPNGSPLYLVAYSGTVATFAQLVWSISLDGGTTWSPWALLSPSDQDQRHLSLAVDGAGDLHAAWRQRPTGADTTMPTQIHYAVWVDQQWSTPTIVGVNPTGYQFFPSLTIGRDGRRWLAWLETATDAQFPNEDPQTGAIYYATQAASAQAAWRPPLLLRPATTDLYPTLGQYTKPAQPRHRCDEAAGVELLWSETIASEQHKLLYTCLTPAAVVATPTATVTPTATSSATLTVTVTPTLTGEPTATATARATATPSATATTTPSPTPTPTVTASSTASVTPTPSATATPTATATATPVTAHLSLVSGWNLVALPMLPNVDVPNLIFAPVSGQYNLLYAYNGCDSIDPWQKYDPAAPFPFLNDLTKITINQGLWIRATANTTLPITGNTPLSTAIPLCAGWNLISWPGQAPAPISTALASISDQYNLVYAYMAADSADPWKKYDPNAPFPFLNDLAQVKPGQGYWLRMIQAATLQVGP